MAHSSSDDDAVHAAISANARKQAIRELLMQYHVCAEEIERMCRLVNTRAKLQLITNSLRGHMRQSLKVALHNAASGHDYETQGVVIACQAIVGPEVLHPAFKALSEKIEPYRDEFSEILLELFEERWNSKRYALGCNEYRDLKLTLIDRSWSREKALRITDATDSAAFWQHCVRKLTEDQLGGCTMYGGRLKVDIEVGALIILSSQMTNVVNAANAANAPTVPTETAPPPRKGFLARFKS